MKWSRLFVCASVVTLSLSPATAQESTVLQVEVMRDSAVVARPQLRVSSGREGRVDLDGQWAAAPLKGLQEKIVITPTVRGNDITLAFNITSGDRQFRPSLVISKDVRGSVEWAAADGQPLRLSIPWVQ
jgi:hypothetical protein